MAGSFFIVETHIFVSRARPILRSFFDAARSPRSERIALLPCRPLRCGSRFGTAGRLDSAKGEKRAHLRLPRINWVSPSKSEQEFREIAVLHQIWKAWRDRPAAKAPLATCHSSPPTPSSYVWELSSLLVESCLQAVLGLFRSDVGP